jgi:hypothetical protein
MALRNEVFGLSRLSFVPVPFLLFPIFLAVALSFLCFPESGFHEAEDQ